MSQTKLTKQDRLEIRNERIRKRFDFFTSKKKWATNYTLEQLADEFLPLTEDTIWLIVSKTGFYKTK
ncbi:hypothetical protein [Flavobacterium maritimum]|uniref:hypothetical protein n=1 Tax=Flavobacterium maritimum TaxID=3149042 RepID=UPI0032B3A480